MTMTEVAERISSAIEKPVCCVNVPPEDHRKMLLEHGIPSFLPDGVYELFAERRARPYSPRSGNALT
jgi:hypothetical protein